MFVWARTLFIKGYGHGTSIIEGEIAVEKEGDKDKEWKGGVRAGVGCPLLLACYTLPQRKTQISAET